MRGFVSWHRLTGSSLISVGSRGLGFLARLRLGGVSTKLLRASTGPVLVISCP
ncbi:MAG TPA: universal stress protein [Chloroflexia bacterium]|nr:universal stress protein [Chloroflexia bacterium]